MQTRVTDNIPFRLAPPSHSNSSHDANTLELLTVPQGAFDALAMGNYPFPSSYMGGTPQHPLPAWPMRVACLKFTKVCCAHEALD